jgi:heavy metal efflux system protein
VPASFSHAIGSETRRPLAVVIVFGTLSACALTLVLLPVVCRLCAAVAERVVLVRRRIEVVAKVG